MGCINMITISDLLSPQLTTQTLSIYHFQFKSSKMQAQQKATEETQEQLSLVRLSERQSHKSTELENDRQ